ncbi:MAG: AsmA family protein [Oceanicaulis sp.]|uniref:AsmA family protein n=1 Tax=Glycocaulis sp. TaxID=1969725 RepID=UPI0025C5BC26|nr:AsmA family protein [Glycocaulis sp.]MCC5980665.1 AsmA family protein [Oceanicaulis sp.]MCH8521892.1 AsmA family protein [Glycocaulis sp.]
MFVRILVGLVALVFAACLALVLVIQLAGWDWLRGRVEERVSHALDRQVTIAEPLAVRWRWNFVPRVRFEGVTISDEDWTGDEHFIQLERAVADVALLDLLRGRVNLREAWIRGLELRLSVDDEGRNNWGLGREDGQGRVPIVGGLHLVDSQIIYRNAAREVSFTADLDSVVAEDEGGADRTSISGQGEVRGSALSFTGEGDGVMRLRDPDQSFAFRLDIEGGETRFVFDGQLGPRGSFRQIAGALALQGENMREVYDFTGIPVPDTPPYDLTLDLARVDDVWQARNIEGEVGDSDLSGQLDYDTGRDRPYVDAQLASTTLDFSDIGMLIGAPAIDPDDMTESQLARAQARALRAEGRIFPNAPLDVERISGVDGRLVFEGREVTGAGQALTEVSTIITLDDRVLRFDPLEFGFRGGRLVSVVEVDARGEDTVTSADATFTRIRLEDFIPNERIAGTFSGEISLVGTGDSIRRAMANSNGRMRALVDEGGISRRTLELIGLDLLNYLFANDATVATTCGMADIVVTDGVGEAETLLVATPDSQIHGEGRFDFRRERFDLRVQARDTSPNIGSLGGPINIAGTFRDPDISPDDETYLRGAATLALGTFLTPLAGLLGTVQLDTVDGGVCERLLGHAEAPDDE